MYMDIAIQWLGARWGIYVPLNFVIHGWNVGWTQIQYKDVVLPVYMM